MNDGVKAVLSGLMNWQFWTAAVSAVVAVISLRVAKQSIEISLYPSRKEIMEKLRNDKYDDIFFDVAALFGEKIAHKFMTTNSYYEDYKKHLEIINVYQAQLKADRPEIYNRYDAEFRYVPSQIADKEKLSEVFEVCKDYKLSIDNDIYDKPLTYEELVDRIIQSRKVFLLCKLDTLSQMQNKLSQGISPELPFTKKWRHTYIGYLFNRTFGNDSNTADWYVTKDSAHKEKD